MILPKCWIAAVPKYWTAKEIPKDLPQSSSKFSPTFDTKEVAAAVQEMEKNLSSEDNNITKDVELPAGEAIKDYVGTYDVKGKPNVETLLFPEKLDSSVVDVVAYHYNEENTTWEQVKDAHIVDGYVYGTLEKFSPIAIFTVKRIPCYTESSPDFNSKNVLECNGVPVTIKAKGEKTVAVTDDGLEIELGEKTYVFGGTLHGFDLDSTSITMESGNVYGIYGSSASMTSDKKVKVGKVEINITGATSSIHNLYGSCWNCVTDKVVMKLSNVEATNISAGVTVESGTYKDNLPVEGNESCDTSKLGLDSPGIVKDVYIKADNVTAFILYTAGSSGYTYTYNAKADITGGKYTWLCNCSSNGKFDESTMTATDVEIGTFNTANRGTAGIINTTLNNCTITDTIALAIVPEEDLQNSSATIKKINTTINGGSIAKLDVGAVETHRVTLEDAKKIFGEIKISSTTQVDTYVEDTESILKELGIIK